MNATMTSMTPDQAQPSAPTPVRAAVSFARMLVLAQRRFRAQRGQQMPATAQI